jgi:hypothetical protein
MNTDEEMSEGRTGLVFRRPLNGALSGRLENHVFIFYPCLSVSIRGFKSVLLNCST